MEPLPTELLHLILTFVPKSSLTKARLTSRAFNILTFPILFAHINHWLDFKLSHGSIISLAHDYCSRPAVMWSPWATEPVGKAEDVWVRIVWKILMRSEPPMGDNGIELTAHNFAELSGREEMSENRLRTGQNRFLLYRSYTEDAKENIFKKAEGGNDECDIGFEM